MKSKESQIIHRIHSHTHAQRIICLVQCRFSRLRSVFVHSRFIKSFIYFDFAAAGVEKHIAIQFQLPAYLLNLLTAFYTCTCLLDCTACEQNLIIIYFWPNGDNNNNNNEDNTVGAITNTITDTATATVLYQLYTFTTNTRNMARKWTGKWNNFKLL